MKPIDRNKVHCYPYTELCLSSRAVHGYPFVSTSSRTSALTYSGLPRLGPHLPMTLKSTPHACISLQAICGRCSGDVQPVSAAEVAVPRPWAWSSIHVLMGGSCRWLATQATAPETTSPSSLSSPRLSVILEQEQDTVRPPTPQPSFRAPASLPWGLLWPPNWPSGLWHQLSSPEGLLHSSRGSLRHCKPIMSLPCRQLSKNSSPVTQTGLSVTAKTSGARSLAASIFCI